MKSLSHWLRLGLARVFHILARWGEAYFINTPLQRGGSWWAGRSWNRFNGFSRRLETVETVTLSLRRSSTLLKQGVNQTRVPGLALSRGMFLLAVLAAFLFGSPLQESCAQQFLQAECRLDGNALWTMSLTSSNGTPQYQEGGFVAEVEVDLN